MYSKEQCMQNLKEREINIFELLSCILKGWRKVVFIVLIMFGLMVTGLYVRWQSQLSKENVVVTASIDQLAKESQAKVKQLEALQKIVENMEKYRDESSYMQLNAYNSFITTLQYFVMTENEEKQNIAYDLYINYVEGGEFKEQLQKELNDTLKNPTELVSLVHFSRESRKENDSSNSVFSIKINSSGEKENHKIQEILKKELIKYQNDVVYPLAGEHELKLISESSYIERDEKVRVGQETIEKGIYDRKLQIATLKSQLTAEEKAVFEGVNLVTLGEEETLFPYKMLIPAFLISAFLGIVIYGGFVFVFTFHKVKSVKEVKGIFDFPCIVLEKGELSEGEKGTIKRKIKLLCDNLQIDSLFISFLSKMNRHTELTDILSDIPGVKLAVGNNICDNVEDMSEAKKCGNLFLVIKPYVTSYDTILDIIRICEDYGIYVKGAIVEN